MRNKLKTLTVTAIITMMLVGGLTHSASAAELTQQQYEFIAWTEAQGWTQDDWDAFDRMVRFYTLLEAVERCERQAVEAYIGLLWGPANAPRMQRIVQRESGFNCAAKNRSSTASGLTQQLNIHAWRYQRRGLDWNTHRFNGVANLEIAYELWSESGWAPWALTA